MKELFAILAFIAIFAAVGSMDYQDEISDQEAYCKMRDIWEQEAAKGIPPQMRRGYPNYQPEVICVR